MLNRVMLQGRLAEVPELNHTANGTAVVRFSIAVEDSIETNGERKTYFFTIQAWQGTAEIICKYFDKGQQIIVEGRLVSKTYTDKNDVKRKEVYIVAADWFPKPIPTKTMSSEKKCISLLTKSTSAGRSREKHRRRIWKLALLSLMKRHPKKRNERRKTT